MLELSTVSRRSKETMRRPDRMQEAFDYRSSLFPVGTTNEHFSQQRSPVAL